MPTNKTDRHDITEILLKVVLNIITHTKKMYIVFLLLLCFVCLRLVSCVPYDASFSSSCGIKRFTMISGLIREVTFGERRPY